MKKKLYLVFSISFFLVTIFLIGYEVISNITHKDPTPSIVLRPFTINDNLEDGNGKKATIILLAGQSNAAGVSHNDYLEKNVTEDKFNEYNQGYDNVYINYYSSVLNESSGFVKCKLGQGYRSEFFGPELGLAEKLNEMYPDQQFFIIKFAEGATNLFYHWVSPSSNKVGGQYYYDFVNFVHANVKYLKEKHYDVSINSLCWMQGESDACAEDTANDYGYHLMNFINDIRKEFSPYQDKNGIYFIDALIANRKSLWIFCDIINQTKTAISLYDLNSVIDTNLLGLTTDYEPYPEVDVAHYDSLSTIKLGHAFAEEIYKHNNK